jgi:hypothetical protein
MFPFDWYWIVAGDITHVYSSKRLAYFPVNDAAFLTWKATFGDPSQIPTEAEMLSILAMFAIGT